jgi:hypothetical protein
VLPALMLGMLLATALLIATSLRLERLVPTLLAAYIALLAETSLLTLVLSPFREVKRGPLALSQGVVLTIALVVWWRRGKPRLGPARGARAAANVARDPPVVALLAVVAVALAYELVLVLTVPANNWDSLTYHLARVAAWVQHGGLYWIPNAPTDRMNEFQPLAEQEILFLFVATGKGALFALPQFVAELALVGGIYTASQRLGYTSRQALLAALFFATFTLVALEATTAQNDLVAASLSLLAVVFLLGETTAEACLAGIALALGLGVKLTTALVLPVIVLLAWRSGRRRTVVFAGSGVVAFAAVAMWSFVLNVVETGHVLGHGGGRVEQFASPSFPGSFVTGLRILHHFLDRSGFEGRATSALLLVAIVVAPVWVIASRRRGSSRRAAWTTAGAFALPLLAPTLVAGLAVLLQSDRGRALLHVISSDRVNVRANEDLSAFGPLGLVLLGASVATVAAPFKGSRDIRRVALGFSLPLFLTFLAFTSKYNPWLARFLIVPAALTAPLLAALFRKKAATLAIVLVAAATLGLALSRNQLKPLDRSVTRPWQLTEVAAVKLTWKPEAGTALARLDALVAGRACLGAVIGVDEPSYLLFGPRLERPVTFLPRERAPEAAERAGVPYVVIGGSDVAPLADGFKAGGWRLHALAARNGHPGKPYWTLAINPRGGSGQCRSSAAAEQAKTRARPES